MTSPANLRDIWMAAAEQLEAAGIPDARFEAEVLLRQIIGRSRAEFYAHLEDPLQSDIQAAFDNALERRRQREPLAYITGVREFYSLEFRVTPDVLIPRPESELLVQTVLDHLGRERLRGARVVDVGTGSGAVGIAIAKNRRDVRLLGIDTSREALLVGRENAQRLAPRRHADWLQGDLLTSIAGPVECIVANLPYMPEARLPELEPEVAQHEPWRALTPGVTGSELILRLVTQLGTRLAPRGIAVLEVGDGQSEEVATAARRLVALSQVEVLEDLGGIPRAVKIVAG